MKTIAIVCEGDRDYDMITETILHFMDQEYRFLWLQPNQEFGTEFGSGWKGVWHWCATKRGYLDNYLKGVTPNVDLLIIQMDADVARCEAEAYCGKVQIDCAGQPTEDPLNCSTARKSGCPQPLPPNSICDGAPQSLVGYLYGLLTELLNIQDNSPVVITIPCDSTDTWVLAAFENDIPYPESLVSPWTSVIARKKDYHGIRIPNRRKAKQPYSVMIKHVCENWKTVKEKCPQALTFETQVRMMLDNNL